VHKVHRRLRRRKLLLALGLWNQEREESLESCIAPGVSAEQYAEIVCLDYTLRKLPDAERVAWQLRYVEGQSLDEVAEQCGCSLSTVKRRIGNADAVVRRWVGPQEGKP
jgi:RNA polymerase sigma-70 factor (ECF subfamily)